MARKVTAAGGFYSFISHGLGRELGMAHRPRDGVAYSVFEVSLIGGFAYFATLQAGSVRLQLLVVLAALVFMVAPDLRAVRTSTSTSRPASSASR